MLLGWQSALLCTLCFTTVPAHDHKLTPGTDQQSAQSTHTCARTHDAKRTSTSSEVSKGRHWASVESRQDARTVTNPFGALLSQKRR